MANEPSWLIEARKHLGLSEVKGAAHNAEILKMWRDIKRGGIKDDETPWCFPGHTEILTESGFVRFDQLAGERVYQVGEQGAMSLTTPIRKVVKDYNGQAFSIKTRSIDIMCDAGHRWWGRWGKRAHCSFGTLDELHTDGLSIPAVASGQADAQLTDSQLALLAAFISDGKVRYSESATSEHPVRIEFEVSKARKIEALSRLGPSHVYRQRKAYGPLTKTPLTVFTFPYPAFFSEALVGYKQLSRGFINSLSACQASAFLAHFARFDGNNHPTKTVLYTSEQVLRDDLVTLAVLGGMHPSVQGKRGSMLSDRHSWTVCFSPLKQTRTLRKAHVTEAPYSGLMHCVEVPNGRIVVRGTPESSPIVTGNCAAFVGSMLERSGVRSTRFESAKSYLQWGVTLTNPVVGCVVVFSRDGGGHVGFFLGYDKKGNLLVLGGNQSDGVNVRAFPVERATGYRYPATLPIPTTAVPILSAGPLAVKES